MPFHLQVSTQRDPGERSDNVLGEPHRAARVATVEIVGDLSVEDRHELRERVEALVPAQIETVVIHLVDIRSRDPGGAAAFCDWIATLRATAIPVHVAALQYEIYVLLKEQGGDPEWLMPFSGSETSVARKVVKLDGPVGTS